MNNSQFQTGQDVQLRFTGQITINAQMLHELLAEMRPPSPEKPPAATPCVTSTDKRLAYTMAETALAA
jgi:hypothetical protein